MVLKQDIQELILKEGKLSLAIADGLGFTQGWIRQLAHANKDNGPLTTAKALQVIGKETGLENDKILEEETVNESIGKAS